jgi:myo-inositol-1(or 4)-monophosphatase
MPSPPSALAADWLGASRAAAQGLREVLREHPTSRERVIETGTRGEGGDRTLVIDEQAEEVVFGQLDALHAAGARFTAVSEERGVVDYGAEDVRVLIDPIDGSLNAKRGMSHYAISIAVADGPTMADVAFQGRRIDTPQPERRLDDGRLEMIAIESSDPRWMAPAIDALAANVYRVRAIGSIAISLCQLATTRVDGMLTLWRTRAVDVAAAQLIVRETGALVDFPAFDEPLGAPLDLAPHSPVVAARTPEALAQLRSIVT